MKKLSIILLAFVVLNLPLISYSLPYHEDVQIDFNAVQVVSPMPGKVTNIFVFVGQEIEIGDNLFKIEAMKMEVNVNAELRGIVRSIDFAVGDTVEKDAVVLVIDQQVE